MKADMHKVKMACIHTKIPHTYKDTACMSCTIFTHAARWLQDTKHKFIELWRRLECHDAILC